MHAPKLSYGLYVKNIITKINHGTEIATRQQSICFREC